MLVLDANDVMRLLDMPSCIRAVEEAFRARGEGRAPPSATLGFPLEGGGLHVKVASLDLSRRYVVAKVNANFPGNPVERKLPTIQGVLVLLDGTTGTPLAVMDSAAITTIRTAATTAVAASRLARADASTATFVGCGVQARAHLAALREVRDVKRVFAVDCRRDAAERFVERAIAEHGVSCSIPASLGEATRASEIIVTLTPSERPLLHAGDVRKGAFIAAVGADNRGSLDQVIAGSQTGRLGDDEIIVFDSTGLAIEDVAAAALVYERSRGAAQAVPLGM